MLEYYSFDVGGIFRCWQITVSMLEDYFDVGGVRVSMLEHIFDVGGVRIFDVGAYFDVGGLFRCWRS